MQASNAMNSVTGVNLVRLEASMSVMLLCSL